MSSGGHRDGATKLDPLSSGALCFRLPEEISTTPSVASLMAMDAAQLGAVPDFGLHRAGWGSIVFDVDGDRRCVRGVPHLPPQPLLQRTAWGSRQQHRDERRGKALRLKAVSQQRAGTLHNRADTPP